MVKNLKSRINALKFNKDREENLIKMCIEYRKVFGLTHYEMMKEPIPVVLGFFKLEEKRK